ncbi:hypothetical protein [Acinetobacter sp. ANC 4779]|nr:hypothetical protein [Acinetobacter sp. ANC 4779]
MNLEHLNGSSMLSVEWGISKNYMKLMNNGLRRGLEIGKKLAEA